MSTLQSINVEGVSIKSHTMTNDKGEITVGFMVYLSNKKMGFFSADRLAKFQVGLRESGSKLQEMLKENIAHVSKGYDVAFGEAKPPEGAVTKKKDDDLDFSAILSQNMSKINNRAVESATAVNNRLSTEQPVDTHDVFDALNLGF
jgi:flagellar hook-basal body complex protein FliE